MIKLFGRKDPNHSKQVPRPPEPEFFDPPDNDKTKGLLGSILHRPSAKLLLIVTIAVLFLFVLLSSRQKAQKQQPPQITMEEKRAVVTQASLERAIDVSAGNKSVRDSAHEPVRAEKRKRKYDTEIAVFVAKPEKGEQVPRQRTDREKPVLGLSSGTKIPALLPNCVFSFNVEAPVIVVVAKDFIVHDKVVIPKDSEFLGEAAVIKSLDRINVRFDLLIFPDGREIRVRALALSEDGSAGIKGKVDKHTDQKVLKAIGETMLAGASLFAGGRQTEPYSLENQMQVNLARNLTDEAARDLRSTKIEKSVTVEAYTPIKVMLLEAV